MGGRAVCNHSDLPFHRSPAGSKKTQDVPPDPPISVLDLPRDTSQTDARLCPFWAAPFSATTVMGGSGQLETKQHAGWVSQLQQSSPPSAAPPTPATPFYTPNPPPRTSPLFPESPISSCNPGSGGHKGLSTQGLLGLMWDLPNIDA